MGFISACYSQVSRTLQQIGEMFSSPTAVKTMAVAAASIGAYSLYSLSQNDMSLAEQCTNLAVGAACVTAAAFLVGRKPNRPVPFEVDPID